MNALMLFFDQNIPDSSNGVKIAQKLKNVHKKPVSEHQVVKKRLVQNDKKTRDHLVKNVCPLVEL
jgi:hypothetical protein